MYIVERERLLGYTIGKPSRFARMVVMRVDVENGGDSTLIDREVLASNYREATKEDEERFSIKLEI